MDVPPLALPHPGHAMTEQDAPQAPNRTSRIRRSAARSVARLEVTVLGRLWSRLLELEFVDRSVALAVSFTTALQRVYLRAWRRPPGGGVRNKGRGALWVGGFVLLMIVVSVVRSLLPGPSGPVLSWAVGLIGATGLWWWTARLMLRGEIRYRALLPTGVITGVGTWVYALAASVWMPGNVTNQFAEFGAFGIAMAIVTWFTGLAFLIVGAAAIAPALTDGEGRVARWLRADQPTAVEPGAAPALPGPTRPVRLSDAFGRGHGLSL